MPLDQTIALQVKPPSANDALDTYSKMSEIGRNQAQTNDINTQAAQREYDLRSEQIARAANEVLQAPEGSQQRTDMWNQHVQDLHNKGYLNNIEYKQFYNNPSSLVLNQAIARGTKVSEQMGMTGVTQGLQAGRTAPYHETVTTPEQQISYPAMRPGGPPIPTGPGQVPGNGSPMNITPGAAPTTAPMSPTRTAPSTVGGGGAAPKANSSLPYYNEIPSNPVAPDVPKGPGVVQAGQHPLAVDAAKAGQKELQEDIAPNVKAAQATKASLGTMISELQSGRVQTSRLADIKMEVAGFINGVLGEKDGATAKKVTGLDLPWSEALSKETTRMGLSYARQTEGAREAVQAIQIALRANPGMLNTVDGNLKIAKIMNAASDYDIDRGGAANSYYRKQQDTTGAGHLQGFEQWYNQDHSPAAFISKVVPYQMPGTQQDLKPGITYEWPKKGPDGKPQIDPKSKQPMLMSGTYDDKRGGFVHVSGN